MAKIYISSTYCDLENERATVYRSLSTLSEHKVIAMEDYVASDRRPKDQCLLDVAACDIYVGIFAFRYGHVPEGECESITALEYRAARAQGKPTLIFMVAPTASWPIHMIDQEPSSKASIDSLRAELAETRTVSYFKTSGELGTQALAAVVNHLQGEAGETVATPTAEALKANLKKALQAYTQVQGTRATAPEPPRPYCGLRPFLQTDSRIFYGREREIQRLLDHIQNRRFTVLHGASGVGKTSLLNAGIIPALPDDKVPLYLELSPMRIESPLAIQLYNVITDRTPSDELPVSADLTLRQLLLAARVALKDKMLVIFLDRFESFFLYSPPDTRRRFVRQLDECRHLPVRFVVSIRKEFFSDLSELEQTVPGLFRNHLKLEPLDEQEAHAAIVKPAAHFGVGFAPELVEELLDDLKHDGHVDPPQLQLVCEGLYSALEPEWEEHPSDTKPEMTLTSAHFDSIERTAGILRAHLNDVLATFKADLGDIAKSVLIELTNREGQMWSATDFEREVGRDKLSPVLDKLIEERLIVRDGHTAHFYYALAHAYLTEEIKNWVSDEALELKVVKELLAHELRNWRNFTELPDTGQQEEFQPYIGGERLRLIQHLRNEGRLHLGEDEEKLISESIRRLQSDAEKQLDIVESAKMVSRAQLVTLLDRELTAPLASLKANSPLLGDSIARTKEILQELPDVLSKLREQKETYPKLQPGPGADAFRPHLDSLFDAISQHVVASLSQQFQRHIREQGLWDEVDEITEILGQVTEAADGMTELLATVSPLIRTTEKIEAIEPRRELEIAILLLRGKLLQTGIQVCCDTTAAVGAQIRGSSGELAHVLMILLLNGIDAIEAHQSASRDGLIRVTIRRDFHRKRVIVELIDNGAAISAQRIAEVISGDYATTAEDLGLPYAKKLVEKHGGSMLLHDVVGQDTAVHIDLPIIE